jgi:hypothetical protein
MVWADSLASEMVKWQRRSIVLSAFGLVGVGVIIGAGSVYILYIKQKLEEHLHVQSAVIQEIQNEVTELRSSITLLSENSGTTPSKKGLKKSESADDDEYVTADEDEDDTGHRISKGYS